MSSFTELNSDISMISHMESEDVTKICHFSFKFLLNGLTKKENVALAQSLSLDLAIAEKCVTSVAYLFLKAFQTNGEIFKDGTDNLNASKSTISIIEEFYEKNKSELISVLSPSLNAPQYKGLQWRLESELASRSLSSSLTPRVVMRLELERAGKSESIALTSDIPNIIHWSQMVEQALAEARTPNTRKLRRILT